MNVADPIRRVSVVSTGQVQIRPDHEASNWRPMAWWLLASRRWTGPRPINAYVIEHRGAQRPVGRAGAGDAGEPLQGAGRALGHRAAHRRLDELDEHPAGELRRRGVLARPLRRGQRLLIATPAVAQHRVRPPNEAERSSLTPAPHVVGGDLDQMSGLCFPAVEDGQDQGAVRHADGRYQEAVNPQAMTISACGCELRRGKHSVIKRPRYQ
jgi:hypothetical protein